jgi:hypothetical protein
MHSNTTEPNKVPRPSDILGDAPTVKNAKIVKKITPMPSQSAQRVQYWTMLAAQIGFDREARSPVRNKMNVTMRSAEAPRTGHFFMLCQPFFASCALSHTQSIEVAVAAGAREDVNDPLKIPDGVNAENAEPIPLTRNALSAMHRPRGMGREHP